MHVTHTVAPLIRADGFGALVSPLVGTSLLDAGRSFQFLYLVSAAIGSVTLASLLLVFRPWRREAVELERVDEAPAGLVPTLRLSIVHLFALFILLLVGATDTMGAYVSAWLIQTRGAPTSAGCASGICALRLTSPSTSTQSTSAAPPSAGYYSCR